MNTSTLPFRDINVHSSPSYYAFSSPSSPSAPTLVVDRPTGDLRLQDGKLLGTKRVSSIAGILGILQLRLDKYVIVITKATPAGRIKGHMIYKIGATELLPLRDRPLHDPDEDNYLSLVKTLLNTGPMYFSYSFDITNSFQRQAQADPGQPMWKRADDRFFWNRYIQTDLINFRNGLGGGFGSRNVHGPQPQVDPYILPVMFGMMEVKNTSIHGNPLAFLLITRRSRRRAGTRYFSRGLDEQGHASNFNETEQAIILNDNSSGGGFSGVSTPVPGGGSGGREAQVLSYVQTRGSVPAFWAEVNTLQYTPRLQILGVESAVPAAKLHFEEQIRLYGDNWLVNLVNQKGREKRVKDAYEQMVRLLVSNPQEERESDAKSGEKFRVLESAGDRGQWDRLHYVYFDFHNETKGLRWHRAKLLLEQLQGPVRQHGYFHGIDNPAGAGAGAGRPFDVRRTQTAVVRTNCMDCLDRTNVVQSMLGRHVLTLMLADLALLPPGSTADSDGAFEHLFRNVWADNADVVSRAYSGTGALKTDFTRTGARTRRGALADLNASVTRYARNNFADGPRQDAYDLLLGAHVPSDDGAAAGRAFADARPPAVQAVPYTLAAALFFVLVGALTRRDPGARVWPLRLAVLLCLGVAAACLRFMWLHGALYVNWPKLNTPPWALDAYQAALARAQADPVAGPLVAAGSRVRRERGRSDARLGFLEEGKKRVE